MWNTAAEFKERKTRPGRKPDYVSRNKRTGEVSSEYWYTKDGVIRGSNHWGPEVGSCDWALDGITGAKGRDVFNPGSELYVGSSKRYGKAKWSDFTQKTENIVVGGKVIGTTNFENTTGKETVKVGEKEYVRFQRNDWMDSKLMKKSIEYIEEVEKFNPYHGPDGRFTSAGRASSVTFRPGASRAHDNAIERERIKQNSYYGIDRENVERAHRELTDNLYGIRTSNGHYADLSGEQLFREGRAKDVQRRLKDAEDMLAYMDKYGVNNAAKDKRHRERKIKPSEYDVLNEIYEREQPSRGRYGSSYTSPEEKDALRRAGYMTNDYKRNGNKQKKPKKQESAQLNLFE